MIASSCLVQEQADIAKDVPDDPPDAQRYQFGAQYNHNYSHRYVTGRFVVCTTCFATELRPYNICNVFCSDGFHGRPYDGEAFGGPHHLHNRGMDPHPDSAEPHFAGAPNMPSSAMPMAPPPPPPPRNGDFNGNQHGGNQRRDPPPPGSKHPGFSPEGNFSAKLGAMSGRGHGGRHARRGGPDNRSSGPGRSHYAAAPPTNRSTSQASSTAVDTQAAGSTNADVQPSQQNAGAEHIERSAEQIPAAHSGSAVPTHTPASTPAQSEAAKPASGPTAVQSARPDVDCAQSMRVPQQSAESVAVHQRQPPPAGVAPPGSVPMMQLPVHAVQGHPVSQSMQPLPSVTAVPILQGVHNAAGGVPLVAAGVHPHTAGLPMAMHIAHGAMMQQVPSASGPQVAPMHSMHPAQMGAIHVSHMPPHAQRHIVQVIPQNMLHPVAVQQRHPGAHMEQARPQPPPPAQPAPPHPNAVPVAPGPHAAAHAAAAAAVAAAGSVEQRPAVSGEGRQQAQRGARAGHENGSVAAPGKDGVRGNSQRGEREGYSDARAPDRHMHGRGHNGARVNTSSSRQGASAQPERGSHSAGEKHERQQAGHLSGRGQRSNDGPPAALGRGRGGEGRGLKEGRGRGRGVGRGTGERYSGDGAKHRADWDTDHGRGNAAAAEGPAGEGRGHLRGRGRRQDAAEHRTGPAEGFSGDSASRTGSGGMQPGRGRGQGHISGRAAEAGRGRMNGRGPTMDAGDRPASADVRAACEGGSHGASHARNGSAAATARVGRGFGEQGRGTDRVHASRAGRHSHVNESVVNVESAAAAAKAAAAAASVSVDIAPTVFTQALAKLEAFNVQVCDIRSLFLIHVCA